MPITSSKKSTDGPASRVPKKKRTTSARRVAVSITLSPGLLTFLEQQASEQSLSLSRLIETDLFAYYADWFEDES